MLGMIPFLLGFGVLLFLCIWVAVWAATWAIAILGGVIYFFLPERGRREFARWCGVKVG